MRQEYQKPQSNGARKRLVSEKRLARLERLHAHGIAITFDPLAQDGILNLREAVLDHLFSLPEGKACRKFKDIRSELKGIFAGQEINAVERILHALARMDREGYVLSRAEMRTMARDAASDLGKIENFLYFVPEKVPYRARMEGGIA